MSLGKEYLAEHVYERYNDNSNNNPICKYCDKCPIKWEKCNGSKYGADGCPLQSLEQLKQEVRREFAERLKASVSENSYTVYYNKFSSDNGMTEDGFAELIDDQLKQYEVKE